MSLASVRILKWGKRNTVIYYGNQTYDPYIDDWTCTYIMFVLTLLPCKCIRSRPLCGHKVIMFKFVISSVCIVIVETCFFHCNMFVFLASIKSHQHQSVWSDSPHCCWCCWSSSGGCAAAWWLRPGTSWGGLPAAWWTLGCWAQTERWAPPVPPAGRSEQRVRAEDPAEGVQKVSLVPELLWPCVSDRPFSSGIRGAALTFHNDQQVEVHLSFTVVFWMSELVAQQQSEARVHFDKGQNYSETMETNRSAPQ